MVRSVLMVLAMLSVGPPSAAAQGGPCLAPSRAVTVLGEVAGATLRFEDGSALRLADLVVPPAVRDASQAFVQDFATAPLAIRSLSDAPRDRYGALIGDVVIPATGASLREALLAAGLALVDPVAMSERCLGRAFAAEREAERNRRGIWRAPPLHDARADLAPHTGTYVLVEGTVLSVGKTRRTLYLNFGRNYRADFTALADRRAIKAFEDALSALAGANVRVRGVLEEWNGGLIRIEHPAQVRRRAASR